MIRGIIAGLEDHGSIILMRVEGRDGAENLVYFDRRMFGDLCAARYPDDIVGCEVEVRGSIGEQTVEFDPDPEYADAEPDQVAS